MCVTLHQMDECNNLCTAWSFPFFIQHIIVPYIEFASWLTKIFFKHRSELRLDAFLVTIVDFLGCEPITLCTQVVYSNHLATALTYRWKTAHLHPFLSI